MKKIHVLIILNLVIIRLYAQNFEWTKREGLWEYDYGYGIDSDDSGNVYISGKYEMNANFSGTILPLQGNHDIYVAKYTPSGDLTWIQTAGGLYGDYARSLACDGVNYVYIAGEIEGFGTTINFTGSPITLTSIGVNDVFFAKYDLNGNLLWAKQAGGFKNDEALGITYDDAGNVYICGFFNDNATFGTTIITGQGGNDMFVAKYDKNGVFQWVKTAGGAGRDEAKSIKCDTAGNVYVCGMFENGALFNSQTLTSPNGYFDAFLAKYAPDGTLVWVKTAGGDYDDVAWALTIDNNNKIYVTGEFNAYAHFDYIAIPTIGSADIFVACYDSSGTIKWVKNAGGPLIDRARGIGCDGTNLYITGQFSLSADFDSLPVTGLDSSEIFIAKINNAGDFQWVTSIGGQPDSTENLGYESGDGICAEASGNVYVTGALLNGGLFGSTSFNSYSRTDVFISKLSPTGIPPVIYNQSPKLCAGQSIIVGIHTYTLSGYYTDVLSSYLSYDSTVITNLIVLPAITFSHTKTICAGQGVTVGTHTYTTSGNYTDVFTSYQSCDSTVTTHLTVLPAITFSQTKILCAGQSITVGTHTYTASGNYTDVLTSYQSCDSTVTTYLTVLPAITFTQTKTICAGQSIAVGNHTYTTSGNYTDVLTSYQSCDSTVTTHLTVLPVITFSHTKTLCAGQSVTVGAQTYTTSGNYTDVLSSYQSCDSTVTTYLTVLPAITFSQNHTLCAGQSITVGTHTYTTSGNYTDVLISYQGCDSIVTTQLVVNSVDISVSVSTVTLTANATLATYQWINCNNGNTLIAGQTSQNFTASANGNYAVVVTQSNCSDTSSCYNIFITGIVENSIASFIKIYPNPFTFQTTITFSHDQKQTPLKIMNDLGKEIKNLNFTGRQLIIEKGDLPPGIYFLQVKTELGMVSKKIIINK